MNKPQSDQVEIFLRELRELTAENIKHYRMHIQQISILAGAIAAFLMPVYASHSTTTIQRSLVAISIVMLLLCILIGMLHLWRIITSEAIDLKDMRISIEEKDERRKQKYDERYEKKLKRRDKHDLVNIVIHLLFSSAILVLITSFVLGEYVSVSRLNHEVEADAVKLHKRFAVLSRCGAFSQCNPDSKKAHLNDRYGSGADIHQGYRSSGFERPLSAKSGRSSIC